MCCVTLQDKGIESTDYRVTNGLVKRLKIYRKFVCVLLSQMDGGQKVAQK